MTSLPRACLGLSLLGLSACAAPLPAATSPAPAPPSSGASHAPSDPPVPPGAPAGPVVVIGSDQVTLEGKPIISLLDLDRLETPRKIDALYETLASSRAAWRAAHAGEAAPCIASLVVAPGTSGRAFIDAYLTLSLAGFAKISVAVGGRYVETHGQAPCGALEVRILPEPRPRVLHVQADEHRWRLRVPRDEGPLDDAGEGPRATVESFRAAASDAVAAGRVARIMLHVAPDVSFARLAPFLVEAAALGRRLDPGHAVTFSWHGFDLLPGIVSARPVAAPVAAGRLAPELIAAVVQASFARFRACYDQALTRDPRAQGKADARFVIHTDGRVREAHTTLSGNLPPEVGPCVEAVFESLTFQAPEGGVVSVTYPIQFSPGP